MVRARIACASLALWRSESMGKDSLKAQDDRTGEVVDGSRNHGADMNITTDIKKLGVLFLLTMGLVACGQGPGSPATGSARTASNSKASDNSSTTAQSALLASGDPQAVVTNARQSLTRQKAYRVRSTSGLQNSDGRVSVREFVAPDRMHNIEDGREIIIIGKTMYVKKGDEWKNMGTQMSDMQEKMKEGVQQMSAAERTEATKGLTADYKSLGDEVLDGMPTSVYEMRSELDTKVEGAGPIVTITKFWIGKSDGLFHKEETNGAEAGMKIKITRTYEYDPDIKIEAPIP